VVVGVIAGANLLQNFRSFNRFFLLLILTPSGPVNANLIIRVILTRRN